MNSIAERAPAMPNVLLVDDAFCEHRYFGLTLNTHIKYHGTSLFANEIRLMDTIIDLDKAKGDIIV